MDYTILLSIGLILLFVLIHHFATINSKILLGCGLAFLVALLYRKTNYNLNGWDIIFFIFPALLFTAWGLMHEDDKSKK